MPLSNAERQRRYREKRKSKVDGKRLNQFISFEAHCALQRIAAHQGITIKAVIESMALGLDKTIADKLDVDKPEFNEYYERPQRQRKSDPDYFRLEHDRVVWTCDKCGHVIEAETEEKMVRLREQHRADGCVTQ